MMEQWKRLMLMGAVVALVAGCTSQAPPVERSEGAPVSAPVVAPVVETPVVAEPVPTVPQAAPPETEAPDPTETQAVEAPRPVPRPQAPEAEPPATSLAGLVHVDAPAPEAIPAAWQSVLPERSPWEIASNAIYWLYGGQPYEGPFLAPGLAEKLQRPAAASRAWTQLVTSWAADGRFYFRLRVTGRYAGERLARAGFDLLEVSRVKGLGYVVTGYAHVPSGTPDGDALTVWAAGAPASSQAPVVLDLPGPLLARSGSYLVPLKAAERYGPVRAAGANTYVVDLPDGQQSGALQTVTVNGLKYVEVGRFVQALNGLSGASSQESYKVGVEWNPAALQLILRLDSQHPIS